MLHALASDNLLGGSLVVLVLSTVYLIWKIKGGHLLFRYQSGSDPAANVGSSLKLFFWQLLSTFAAIVVASTAAGVLVGRVIIDLIG